MLTQNSGGRAQTRRQFLVQSSLLAGASAAGTLDLSRSAYAAGSDQIKIGLVGCGGRGSGSIANALSVNPGARLYAMCPCIRVSSGFILARAP
jgi:myo-inositol 2-dehydrogenase / D-chiro-inositol 1-dehydrogenase